MRYDLRCTCMHGIYAEGCPVGAELGNHYTSPLAAGDTDRVDAFKGSFEFLCNFYAGRGISDFAVAYDGLMYPTSEHAFQAAKTFDLDYREHIRGASTPGHAKKLGRRANLRPDWEAVKVEIMFQVCLAKFVDNPQLGRALVNTGSARLVEGNTWGDTFWGVCQGHGSNMLGETLQDIRSLLQRLQDNSVPFVKYTTTQDPA